jgi:hypothetical protein
VHRLGVWLLDPRLRGERGLKAASSDAANLAPTQMRLTAIPSNQNARPFWAARPVQPLVPIHFLESPTGGGKNFSSSMPKT